MSKCIICQEYSIKIKLKCCQKNSESQYGLCRRCFKKCERCPLCRSEKRIPDHQIIIMAEDMFTELYLTYNVYLTRVMYQSSQIHKLQLEYVFPEHICCSDLPPDMNVIQIQSDDF